MSRCSASTAWIAGVLKVVNRVITLQWTPRSLWIGSIFHPLHGRDPGAGWFISGHWPEHTAAAHVLVFYGSSCVSSNVLTAQTLFWVSPPSCLTAVLTESSLGRSCLPPKSSLLSIPRTGNTKGKAGPTGRGLLVAHQTTESQMSNKTIHPSFPFKLCIRHTGQEIQIFTPLCQKPTSAEMMWWPDHLSEARWDAETTTVLSRACR